MNAKLPGKEPSRNFPRRAAWLALFVAAACGLALLQASDHSDVPLSPTGMPRQDANLTDLHAFVVGPNLVLALSMNPAIPPSATSYVFPTDVTFEINLDVDSPVSPADPTGLDGGTVLDPGRIGEDVTFRIRFRADGSARIQKVVRGVERSDPEIVSFFAGLRDDPFIRGPRIGRNVAAIVLEVPLSSVVRAQPTLLIWATSKVEDFDGPSSDLAGRSLKSMFGENSLMNAMHPRQHARKTGKTPDVIIFNTSFPAAFPNGRALTDDVVNLVGDNRVLSNDAPFPAANDVPFLTAFPYLAPPH
jgi:hypothetical protein